VNINGLSDALVDCPAELHREVPVGSGLLKISPFVLAGVDIRKTSKDKESQRISINNQDMGAQFKI
jgi:hypothetical protein